MGKWSIGQLQPFAICYEVSSHDLREVAFAPDGTGLHYEDEGSGA